MSSCGHFGEMPGRCTDRDPRLAGTVNQFDIRPAAQSAIREKQFVPLVFQRDLMPWAPMAERGDSPVTYLSYFNKLRQT